MYASLTHQLTFNNRFYQRLPFAYRQVSASPLSSPYLVAYSAAAAKLIDLPENYWQSKEFLTQFSGQQVPENGHCIAQVYAGHQFGHYVEQLGDGRSVFLGEVKNNNNEHYDIHLKGAGQTPYSRMGDGRAVLRSCIREFLASEAMAALNIPTTRALCITGSSELVYRETPETGAIMTRLSTTHIRFGNFEYLYHQGKYEEVKQLADFCIDTLFPQAKKSEKPYLALFSGIVEQTAKLIGSWQAVGFAHGVMNTDNMSIAGLTIDYGPFAFLDDYQASFVCNHSDHQGRYAFDEQPSIGLWNLNALACTFLKLVSKEELIDVLSQYEETLVSHYLEQLRQKLGFDQWQSGDQTLLNEYLSIMTKNKSDYTLSFRLLNSVFIADENNDKCTALLALFDETTELALWLTKYRQRLSVNSFSEDSRITLQNATNPKFILRNYLAENAIKLAKEGNYEEIQTLLTILSNPYDEQIAFEHYAKSAPQWGKKLEISCSS